MQNDLVGFSQMLMDVLTWEVPGFDDAIMYRAAVTYPRPMLYDRHSDRFRARILHKLPEELLWLAASLPTSSIQCPRFRVLSNFEVISTISMQTLWNVIADSDFEKGTKSAYTEGGSSVPTSMVVNGIDIFYDESVY